jgi:hypothetical protein
MSGANSPTSQGKTPAKSKTPIASPQASMLHGSKGSETGPANRAFAADPISIGRPIACRGSLRLAARADNLINGNMPQRRLMCVGF